MVSAASNSPSALRAGPLARIAAIQPISVAPVSSHRVCPRARGELWRREGFRIRLLYQNGAPRFRTHCPRRLFHAELHRARRPYRCAAFV